MTVPVHDGATVVIVRDGDGDGGLEVLLLRRSLDAVFCPGAHCFPGGRADAGDGGDLRVTAVRETLEEAGLRLDPAGLQPIARWVTPPGQPRRFDTRFFLAEAPTGQHPECDGVEMIECGWWRPADALDSDVVLIEPTQVTLEWLAGHATVADAFAAGPYQELAS